MPRPRFSDTRIGKTAVEAGLLLVLPLFFSRSFAEQFSYPKKVLAEILVMGAASAWVLGAVWGEFPRRRRCRLAWPLALLILATLVSCLNSPVPAFSLREAVYFLCGPVWVLVLACGFRIDGEAGVRRLYALCALGGAAVALIAVLQWSGYDPLLFGGFRVNWGGMVARMRLYATLGNPNFVAGYLVATVFAAAGLAAVSESRRAQVAWGAAVAIMLAALVGAGSRGAWLGLAMGLVAAALALKGGPEPRTGARPMASPESSFPKLRSMAALACLAALPSGWGDLVNAGLRHVEGRVFLWRAAWPMFRDHPLLGSGWATFQLRFLDLQASYLAVHPEMARHWSNIRQLHNDLFQLLLETGLLGLLAFGWVLWVYARQVHPAEPSTRSTRLWLAASAGGITAILVDSFVNFQFAIPPTFILLFTLIAIPELLANRETPPVVNPPPRRWPWVLRLATSLVVVAGAVLLLVQIARDAVAERDYALATQLENRGELARAEESYRHGIQSNPLNGRLHFGLARVLYLADRYPEALGEIPLAERTYVDSHMEVLKGRIQDEMGLGPAALESYRRALALDPTLKTVQADIERLSKQRAPTFPNP